MTESERYSGDRAVGRPWDSLEGYVPDKAVADVAPVPEDLRSSLAKIGRGDDKTGTVGASSAPEVDLRKRLQGLSAEYKRQDAVGAAVSPERGLPGSAPRVGSDNEVQQAPGDGYKDTVEQRKQVYRRAENIIANLNMLVTSGRLRGAVDKYIQDSHGFMPEEDRKKLLADTLNAIVGWRRGNEQAFLGLSGETRQLIEEAEQTLGILQ